MRRITFFILICVGIAAAIIPGPQKPKLMGELRWIPEYTGTPQIFLSWVGLQDTAQVEVFRDGEFLTSLAPGTKNYSDTDIYPDAVYNYWVVVGETLKTSISSFSECQIKNIGITEKGFNYVELTWDEVSGAESYDFRVIPVQQPNGGVLNTISSSVSADNPPARIPLPLCWWNTGVTANGFAIRALIKNNSGQAIWTRWTTWKDIPAGFAVHQNYPNPFNPTTTINYSLPQAETVQLTIYNMLGQKVKELVNGEQQAGSYNIVWDSTDWNGMTVPTGVYFYRIEAGSFSKVQKMTLMK